MLYAIVENNVNNYMIRVQYPNLKKIIFYEINITDFYIENNEFLLLVDFIPKAPENITLLSQLLIEIYNKSSGNMTESKFNLELKIYNSSDIPNKFALDFDILNISGNSEISMLYAIVENNVN